MTPSHEGTILVKKMSFAEVFVQGNYDATISRIHHEACMVVASRNS
jgi:hypothetical protein